MSNLTKEVFNDFKRKINLSNSEADIRQNWSELINKTLHVQGMIHEEEDFRDMSFENVVIEFKDKGLFNHSKTSSKFIEATENRLLKYINRWATETKKDTSFFIGVATDGVDMALCQVIDGSIKSGNLMSLTFNNIDYILDAINVNLRKLLTSQNLIEQFGKDSKIGSLILNELYIMLVKDLQSNSMNKTKLFYGEWVNLYGQVSDIASWKKDGILDKLGFPKNANVSQVLYVINTYNSLLVKFLAAELVSTQDIASYTNFSEDLFLTNNDSSFLRKIEHELELSEFFEASNIHNFVSEVLFSWYLYSPNKTKILVSGLRQLCESLSLFNVGKGDAVNSEDVLKNFYQNLVPEDFRKSLGEFYTPDWMVKYMVDKLPSLSDKSVLDPTCGSGSFLLYVIRKKIDLLKKSQLSSKEILKRIQNEVVGFDLNPLAVQTARVNYLFDIIKLINNCPGEIIEIPILLSDAIYSPSISKKTGQYEYIIGSKVANLKVEIPRDLVDSRRNLNHVFSMLNLHVNNNHDYEDFIDELRAMYPNEGPSFFSSLELTYNRVKSLHEKSWNGIWFQIISNFFWSIELPPFNIVIGNPPWVRWSSLPELYRERVKETAESYDIFSDHKYHGGNELDISALVTYTVADRWLNEDGIMSFLLPQSHLQSDSSSGFRKLKIDSLNLQPINIEDLKNIKIFDDATNKPMIFTFIKQSNKLAFPVDYKLWKSVNKKKTIKSTENLSEIIKKSEISDLKIEPIHGNPQSPWIFGTKQELTNYNKLIGESTYQGRKGITTDLNGIFFPKVIKTSENFIQIETRPEAGRKNIGEARRFWIEKDLIHPLIKGASNIKPGKGLIDSSLCAIVPNQGIGKDFYEQSRSQMMKLPKTYAYFSAYRNLLEERSTYKKFMKGAPYWSVYNVGNYTFAPYKVAWAEIGRTLKASIFSFINNDLFRNSAFIPDHKIYYVPFSSNESAIFLMCLLNNKQLSNLVGNSTVSTSRGDVLKNLHLPIYNVEVEQHRNLINNYLKHQEWDEELNNYLTNQILFS